MRMLLIAAATLALAGCTTTLDTNVQKNLPAICTAAKQAHGVYLVATAVGKVSAKTRRNVDAAWSSLQPLCADPVTQTTASVIAAAFAAYVTISAAAH